MNNILLRFVLHIERIIPIHHMALCKKSSVDRERINFIFQFVFHATIFTQKFFLLKYLTIFSTLAPQLLNIESCMYSILMCNVHCAYSHSLPKIIILFVIIMMKMSNLRNIFIRFYNWNR